VLRFNESAVKAVPMFNAAETVLAKIPASAYKAPDAVTGPWVESVPVDFRDEAYTVFSEALPAVTTPDTDIAPRNRAAVIEPPEEITPVTVRVPVTDTLAAMMGCPADRVPLVLNATGWPSCTASVSLTVTLAARRVLLVDMDVAVTLELAIADPAFIDKAGTVIEAPAIVPLVETEIADRVPVTVRPLSASCPGDDKDPAVKQMVVVTDRAVSATVERQQAVTTPELSRYPLVNPLATLKKLADKSAAHERDEAVAPAGLVRNVGVARLVTVKVAERTAPELAAAAAVTGATAVSSCVQSPPDTTPPATVIIPLLENEPSVSDPVTKTELAVRAVLTLRAAPSSLPTQDSDSDVTRSATR
jgi:hypothetical protein